ncbi:hypothetical protein GCM10010329_79160 [Streptomyces spiroverticillatus]|uniref:Membrane protein YmcC n=1 Tax=Streptomyces finlayi TaxID=67296 RepID=A0A918X8W0_9ACTN|nr:hypothetical protein [Streptomyces finlayi]GHA44648.1 hypothetical protein GCM10010329_79160 [Streptomyces spiroverticillatus]GHD17900.1 hypothetical protein GCM10010334_80140 [Streptomyces finlayi]
MLFWVLLGAGLAARYALGQRALGAALLLCVPLIDVVLLVTTVLSVRAGAEPTIWHGLSAAYLGLTIVYGHRTVRWADAKFAHRYQGAALPERPRLYGRAAVVDAWRSWLTFLLAYAISAGLLFGLVLLVGGLDRGAPLLIWLNPLSKVLIYSLLWPVAASVWPPKAPTGVPAPQK